MKSQRQREIVIEYEKVQTIRKRAKTRLFECEGCRRTADGVSLVEAAELFETAAGEMLAFIRRSGCHYHIATDERVFLCVQSLLKKMQQQNEVRHLPAKGETR